MPDTPLRLVIFDIDGTLVDSQAHILASMRWTFETAGHPVPTRQEALGVVGLSLPQLMAVLLPDADETEIARMVTLYKQSWTHLRQNAEPAPLFPDAVEVITALDKAGILISAATGKSRPGLTRLLAETGLDRVFIGTQTADDAPSKPHPQMVMNCLAATGVEPAQAVMVGDTTFDIEMGKAAGCHAIGVTWGYHPVARLERAGPARMIDHWADLPAALDALWGQV